MNKNKIKGIIFITLIILLICNIYLIESDKIVYFDDKIYSLITRNITEEKTRFFEFISNMASWQCIVFLCLLSLMFIKHIKVGVIICFNSLFSVILNYLLKILFARQRPTVPHLIEQGGYSFPSGHAMAAMSFYGFLIYLLIKSKINIYIKVICILMLFTIIILVGISRVYLGVHYTSDIIGGYITSIIYMSIYIIIINKTKLRFKNV